MSTAYVTAAVERISSNPARKRGLQTHIRYELGQPVSLATLYESRRTNCSNHLASFTVLRLATPYTHQYNLTLQRNSGRLCVELVTWERTIPAHRILDPFISNWPSCCASTVRT